MNTESKVDIYDDSKTTTKKKDEVTWRSCCLIVDPHAIDCSDDNISDLAWTDLVDQIEEWVKCEREEIDLDYR